MATVDAIRFGRFLEYTGSNGAAMAASMSGSVMSESGGVLVVGDASGHYPMYTVYVGDRWNDRDGVLWPAADYAAQHITKAAALLDTNNDAAVAALQVSQATQDTAIASAAAAATAANTAAGNAVAAVAGKLGKADIVSIQVPILLLAGFADRAIVWNRPFSNTSYDLSYAFDASTIGRITCAPVAGTKTTTGITIRVTASLLAVSVLGVVHVLGIGA